MADTYETFPTLESFLAAPIEDVAQVAPNTIIYTVSGTRRSAALAGKPTQGDDYIYWLYKPMIACVHLIFEHGVEHILMPLLTPSQFRETTTNYREKLWEWLIKGLTGPASLQDYQTYNWHVRFLFADKLPQLQFMNNRLIEASPKQVNKYLWLYVVPEANILWQWMLETFLERNTPGTSQAAIQLLYGASIPPATLSIDFGKLIVSPDLLPPFLFEKLHCYWSQRPGYSLDEHQLRSILYDYAFLRPTWSQDKTGRAKQSAKYKEVWEQELTIGLGIKLGPHWYPRPFNPSFYEDK